LEIDNDRKMLFHKKSEGTVRNTDFCSLLCSAYILFEFVSKEIREFVV
jgi:hypothetical protein